VRASYDRLAAEYSERLFDELAGKPLDRALLTELARTDGPVCDLGCGPGHISQFLAEHGADVSGFDLSPEMIAEARRRNPRLRFEVGDILSLPVKDASFAAVLAMYSLIHFGEHELRKACTRFIAC
jgi:trans-aconitate methyltransferase